MPPATEGTAYCWPGSLGNWLPNSSTEQTPHESFSLLWSASETRSDQLGPLTTRSGFLASGSTRSSIHSPFKAWLGTPQSNQYQPASSAWNVDWSVCPLSRP